MPYSAEISRSNPACFLFLVDQSGSMSDPWGKESSKKISEGVADAINRLLQNLIIKCAKSEGVRDYFDIGVIGYGTSVGSAFSGPLAGRDLVKISEVANFPARIEERRKKVDDGAGGIIEQTVKFPIWFEPTANGGTPMCQALTYAHSILQNWLCEHLLSFPPVIINITDGEANDGDPSKPAQDLRSLNNMDGNVLLFNIHASSNKATPVTFADDETKLPDDFAKQLFNMSSELPEYMRGIAQQEGFSVSKTTRGFAFNANPVELISFLDIGTRASNLR
jgi:uncharacterized protein YegL